MRFLLVLLLLSFPAAAQQSGGILHVHHRDSPGTLSIHEETTNSTIIPMMGVFNNLVLFDQHIAQHSIATIVPELGVSWSWDDARTALTFKLHEGVHWHDGKPFTSADVKCTWDLLTGRSTDKLRLNARESWYKNLTGVTVDGPLSVTFHLARPQPSFLAFLASGYSPVYPCHVSPAQMRTNPIGTGPFKFVEFKRGESIKLTRNTDYWKPGRPYLDGVEYTVVPNRSTAILSFVAGKFDMTFPNELTIPLIADVLKQAPQARCEIVPNNVSTNILVNRTVAPFDNPALSHALDLALDRKAFVDILSEGKSDVGGAMLPLPEGAWGLPPEMLRTLPSYGGNVEANREEARKIMQGLGYGPENRLHVKIAARNVPAHREPTVILIDQLKQIFIDGDIDPIETAVWPSRLVKRDFAIALNLTGSGVDDPDSHFYENYTCGASRNFSGYCNKAIDALVDRQSVEPDPIKRLAMVRDIDLRLQQDWARPIIMHARSTTCLQPWVHNLTLMVNSAYNGWRFEDVWLQR